MQILQTHYNNLLQNDCILTDPIKSCFSIPKLKKISLAMGGYSTSENCVLSSIFILEYISGQTPCITCQSSGSVVGAKVTLRKSIMFLFLFKFLFQVLPHLKSFEGFNGPLSSNTFTFEIKDIFVFKRLSVMFPLFTELQTLKLQFHFTTTDKYQLDRLGRSFLFCFLTR